MTHELPDLPYSFDALEPYIDAKTMEIHHNKHHQGYVDKLNKALEGSGLEDKEINELIGNLESVPEKIRNAVRNNGGGHVNHSFWWQILKNGTGFKGEVADAINGRFGNFDKFKEEFSRIALGLFGSGWCWLVLDENEALEIVTTPNQDNPLMFGKKPVLGIDMWEHSFYLKHGPNKPAYLEDFFKVVNWDKVNEHYLIAKK